MVCETCGNALSPRNVTGICSRNPGCLRENQRRNQHRIYSDPLKATWRGVRDSAKKAGVPFNLTLDTIPPIPEYCPCCESPLERKGPWRNQPSLDRMFPDVGYTQGNVQWLCRRCNQLKSNASPEELMRIALFMNQGVSRCVS